MKKEKDILAKLTAISDKMDKIGDDLDREGRAWKAELTDRLKKGITDNDAVIKHYNDWMIKEGLNHLVIKKEDDNGK